MKEDDDPFVTLADEATVQFALSTAPGFLVNLVPAREYSGHRKPVQDLIKPSVSASYTRLGSWSWLQENSGGVGPYIGSDGRRASSIRQATDGT